MSYNKCVVFAAILDSYGKVILGEWSNNARPKYENEYNGLTFYHDHLLPVITSMTSYGSDRGMSNVFPKIQSQLLKVGPRDRISVAYLDGNLNKCHFLAVYWRV